MKRRYTDIQLCQALRFFPNVCATAEALGLSIRGLQRRLVRMRERGAPVPPSKPTTARRWARRPDSAWAAEGGA